MVHRYAEYFSLAWHSRHFPAPESPSWHAFRYRAHFRPIPPASQFPGAYAARSVCFWWGFWLRSTPAESRWCSIWSDLITWNAYPDPHRETAHSTLPVDSDPCPLSQPPAHSFPESPRYRNAPPARRSVYPLPCQKQRSPPWPALCHWWTHPDFPAFRCAPSVHEKEAPVFRPRLIF